MKLLMFVVVGSTRLDDVAVSESIEHSISIDSNIESYSTGKNPSASRRFGDPFFSPRKLLDSTRISSLQNTTNGPLRLANTLEVRPVDSDGMNGSDSNCTPLPSRADILDAIERVDIDIGRLDAESSRLILRRDILVQKIQSTMVSELSLDPTSSQSREVRNLNVSSSSNQLLSNDVDASLDYELKHKIVQSVADDVHGAEEGYPIL